MENKYTKLAKNISILERVMKVYYNRSLEEYDIGWGQQYFIEYLAEHPGATPQELTSQFHVDKATVTKLMKKLTSLGYINIILDNSDKRIRHIYLQDSLLTLVEKIKQVHKDFYYDLTMGIEEEQIESLEEYMDQMIDNLTQKVRYKMEKK